MFRVAALAGAAFGARGAAGAGAAGPSPAAPSGDRALRIFNSWSGFCGTMNDTTFRAAADFLAAELLPSGFDHIVVDGGWYDTAGGPETFDAFGHPTPDPAKYPSTAGAGGGLRVLADYAHKLGLKFGVWDIRGVPLVAVEGRWPIEGSPYTADEAVLTTQNCSWSHVKLGTRPGAAAAAWYASLAAYYRREGVDYVKMDCMTGDGRGSGPGAWEGLYTDDFRAFAEAFKAAGVEVSVSPGSSMNPANASWIAANAYAKHYRITNECATPRRCRRCHRSPPASHRRCRLTPPPPPPHTHTHTHTPLPTKLLGCME